MIVLVGFMGAGKTSVGRLLALRTGLPFVDTDEAIVSRAGMTIPEIFESYGEAGFRALESEVAQEVLRGTRSVVALGGGALTDPATRTALEWAEAVVHLDVSFREAMRRIAADGSRPMLAVADPRTLFVEREPLYQSVAGLRVPVDGRSPDDLAAELVERLGLQPNLTGDVARAPVSASSGSYDVLVGTGLLPRLADLLPELPGCETAFLVTHPNLPSAAALVRAAFEQRGFGVQTCHVPEGERSKSLAMATSIYQGLAERAAHRHDVVVAVGGGVVCDLAGFVASTYNRGMPVINVPTSLLAQVDAAIGGKTGVNLPQGKNLVGTIHQPRGVFCDVDVLDSLPDADFRSGLAEVVKYGLIADPDLLLLVLKHASEVLARDKRLLTNIVSRSASIKASIVSVDEREQGVRGQLNYGHTFGHAIEQLAGFEGIRHGEAIALGMVAAAYLAHELGRIDDELVTLHRNALSSLGLPIGARLVIEDLEETWKRDKKYRGEVRFVLLSGLGRAEVGVAAPRAAVARALERMAA